MRKEMDQEAMRQDEHLWKPGEVAEFLSVQTSTVYHWAQIGYILCIRLGTGKKKPLVRFRESAIIDWLLKRESPGRKTRVP